MFSDILNLFTCIIFQSFYTLHICLLISHNPTEPTGLGAYSSSDEGTVCTSDADHTYTPEITYLPDGTDSDSSDNSFTTTTAGPGSRRTSRQSSRQSSRAVTPTPDASIDSTPPNRSGLFNLSSMFNRSSKSILN